MGISTSQPTPSPTPLPTPYPTPYPTPSPTFYIQGLLDSLEKDVSIWITDNWRTLILVIIIIILIILNYYRSSLIPTPECPYRRANQPAVRNNQKGTTIKHHSYQPIGDIESNSYEKKANGYDNQAFSKDGKTFKKSYEAISNTFTTNTTPPTPTPTTTPTPTPTQSGTIAQQIIKKIQNTKKAPIRTSFAFHVNDHDRVKIYKKKGDEAKQHMEFANDKAKQYRKKYYQDVFDEYNDEDSPNFDYTIDLHRQSKVTAIKYLEEKIMICKEKYDKLHVIVGLGNHNDNGISVLGPAVREWLRNNRYDFQDEEDNHGCIIVSFR